MKYIFSFILFFIISLSLFSQTLNTYRNKRIVLSSDTLKLDSMSIVPNSLFITTSDGKIISDSVFKVDYYKKILILDSKKYPEISASYRVFRFDFSKSYYNKKIDTSNWNSNIYQHNIYKVETEETDNFFKNSEIHKSGSISRGITFGNNQDASVNSSLDLQFAGKLSSDITVAAAVSDNNIPIQSDGSSQQIREFDKVFVQIASKKSKLIVGDFELKNPEGHFLKYNKKEQGASFEFEHKNENKLISGFSTQISAASSKGKYNKIKLSAIEGNQGPYKLSGVNSETYIMVLSGSEKVFVDGKLLERGNNFDYIIDYNTAEITFTAKLTITKDSRIIVEFEYSDKNYARFLFSTNNVLTINNKNKIYINIFSEHDAKNQPVQQDLSAENIEILRNSGDNLSNDFVLNRTKVDTFSINEVLYAQKDTIVSTVLFKDIFEYSTNPQTAKYRLGFTLVGENKGNYRQIQSAANGKVFEWITPINGILQGNYEPIKPLISPKKKQVMSVGGDFIISKTTAFAFETSFSNNDLNTFSNIDSKDDKGLAMFFSLKQKILYSDTNKIMMDFVTNYQYIQKDFEAVERFKSTEFNRDWNISDSKIKSTENLMNFKLKLRKTNKIKAFYDFALMNRNKYYLGYNNSFSSVFKIKNTTVDLSGSNLNSSDTTFNTNFIRYSTKLEHELKYLVFGFINKGERNLWKNDSNLNISPNSFRFNETEIFAKSPESFKNQIFAGIKNREDFIPNSNKLAFSSSSQDYTFGTKLMKNPNNILENSITYRLLNYKDTLTSKKETENTVTAKVTHSIKFLKSLISNSITLEHGSGMEMKKDYSYIKVQAGQGIFAWKDFNNNEKQELNEFVVANYSDEANFIRVSYPSMQYERIYNQSINHTLNLNPKQFRNSSNSLIKLISLFSNSTFLSYNRKINRQAQYYSTSIEDSMQISSNTSIRNTFSFESFDSKTGIDYNFQKTSSKSNLINGKDKQSLLQHSIIIRQNLFQDFIFTNQFNIGTKEFSSEFFKQNNYKLDFYENIDKLNIDISNELQVESDFTYTLKKNNSSNEKLNSIKTGILLTYTQVENSVFNIDIHYVKLNFRGDEKSPIGYEMLDGLKSGNNFLWKLSWTKSISQFLQIQVNYEGRKTESDKIIHIGGMQLRAIF